MFKRFLTLTFVVTLSILGPIFAQNSDVVVAKYGDWEIKMKEFEDAYSRNAGGYEVAKDDSIGKLQSFLDLYVNFKMKLRNAWVRDYDNNPTLQAELLDYKQKVGVSYLLEKEIVEPGIKDLYEKRKWELRVSHLMIRPDSMGEQASREFTQKILDSIKAGASFEEMVNKYSHDRFSQPDGGDIFYITAGLLPVEFEDAAYKTEKGQVYPQIVQTKYGFHIIKVTDKIVRVPSLRASHILVGFYNAAGQIDSAAAKLKLDTVLTALKNGMTFEKVAELYSDDPGSKTQGGDLGFFERRMMVKEFDLAAFSLEKNVVSEVVTTNFGYHIIKVTDKKPYPSLEEEKENLKKIYKQTRYQPEYDALVKELKTRYAYKLDDEGLKAVLKLSDSVRIADEHPRMEQVKDITLFTYNNKKVTAKMVLDILKDNPEYIAKFITYDSFLPGIEKVAADKMLEEDALQLDKRRPEFAELMDDYKSGIYIFKLQDEEVWSKISVDSTKLYNFYLSTKENYKYPERVSFSELYSRSDSLINYYYSIIKNGGLIDTLARQHTERAGLKESSGLYPMVDVKSSELAEASSKLREGQVSEPFQTSGGWSIVRLNKREASRLKTFEEAKPEVSGAFQEAESKRLEKEYIDKLKSIYKPELRYQELEKAFK